MHASQYSPFPHSQSRSARLAGVVVAFFLIGVVVGIQLPSLQNSVVYGRVLAEGAYVAEAPILAVRGDTGEGVIGKVSAEIRPGKGRILVNTNPFIEPDTQLSAETAARVAAKLAGVDISSADVIFSFDVTSNLVGGPSAGVAMTVAATAALENKRLRDDVAFTGTIEQDGSVGMVGGIVEKATAAAGAGKKLLIVPKGEAMLQYYEPTYRDRRVGNFIVRSVSYVTHSFDVDNYTFTEFSMHTIEAASIQEVLEQALE